MVTQRSLITQLELCWIFSLSIFAFLFFPVHCCSVVFYKWHCTYQNLWWNNVLRSRGMIGGIMMFPEITEMRLRNPAYLYGLVAHQYWLQKTELLSSSHVSQATMCMCCYHFWETVWTYDHYTVKYGRGGGTTMPRNAHMCTSKLMCTHDVSCAHLCTHVKRFVAKYNGSLFSCNCSCMCKYIWII